MAMCLPRDFRAAKPLRDVGAVVVTYFPDPMFRQRLAAITRESSAVVVIDNSANKDVQRHLCSLCRSLDAQFVGHSKNRGLARALNRGFHLLLGRGFSWAVAFDQDSTPAAGALNAQLATADIKGQNMPAVIGANWIDEARPGYPSRHIRRKPHARARFERVPAVKDIMDATCVIASGSLFHLPTWRALGEFDESLFLDLVDSEYCLRATISGYSVRVSAAAHLQHRRGSKHPSRCFNFTFWPAFMPPLRLRYLFRNRVLVFRRHGRQVPHWVIFELLYAAKVVAEIIFFEDRKLAKLAACLSGTWDGLLGRSGPIENA